MASAAAASAQAVLWQAGLPWRYPDGRVAYVEPGFAYATGTECGVYCGQQFLRAARVDMAGNVVRVEASPVSVPPGLLSLDVLRDVAASSGEAFATGYTVVSTATGSTITHWLHRFAQAPAGGDGWSAVADVSAAVAAGDDGDDGIYVVGGSVRQPRAQKFDRAGALQWTRALDETGGDGFADVAIFPGGGIVAAGGSDAGALMQRFDAAGNALWPSARVAGLGANVRLLRVAVDAAGSAFAAGLRANAARPDDIVLVKVSAAGAVQWIRERAGVVPANNAYRDTRVFGLVLDARGNAVVNGLASTASDFVLWTAAYDRDGNLAWSDEYAVNVPGFDVSPARLGVDSRGHIYVGGNSFLRKLAPGGSAMWTIHTQGGVHDLTIGAADELLALVSLEGTATLMRIDPGPAAPPPTAQVQLTLPPGPWVSGRPITLNATIHGTILPSGTVTFRVNGGVACNAVALQPTSATAAGASCALPLGLPAGTVLLEAIYSGDANYAAASASSTLVVAADATVEVPTLSPLASALLAILVALGGAAAVRRRAR